MRWRLIVNAIELKDYQSFMGNNNVNLQSAKNLKDDEFYTTYESIVEELSHYTLHFNGKTVLCNCDDPYESNFCKYFLRNFNRLGLSRLICTSYSASKVIATQMNLFDVEEEIDIAQHVQNQNWRSAAQHQTLRPSFFWKSSIPGAKIEMFLGLTNKNGQKI